MKKIFLGSEIIIEMIDAAKSVEPEEACGVLIGTIDDKTGDVTVDQIVPIENSDHHKMHFTLEVKSYMKCVKETRRSGKKIVSIWHSHPRYEAVMSKEDVALAKNPDVLWTIVGYLDREVPVVACFEIVDDKPSSVIIEVM